MQPSWPETQNHVFHARRRNRSLWRTIRLLIIALSSIGTGIVGVSGVASAEDFSPEHEVVKEMVRKGVAYLTEPNSDRISYGIGYELLTAYTILKATEDHDHRLVKAQVPKAQHFADELTDPKSRAWLDEKTLYEASVAAMFLSAMDPIQYRADIEKIRDFLVKVQRRGGGFGYLVGSLNDRDGDVSQSQYVALALWSIKQANIDVNPATLEKLASWLLKVQRGDGGWTYQVPPNDPPIRSMLAAGLSGVLVAADTLGIMRGPGAKPIEFGEEEDDEGIPGAFRRVYSDPKDKDKNFVTKSVSRSDLAKATTNALRWLDTNKPQRKSGEWYYYWLYSRERFESFVEILNGRREKSPAWYNDGVIDLKKNQSANGGWGVTDVDPAGPEADTCFAILFLLRNTQKAIGEIKTADSVGGYGLANVADVGFIDGKLVDKSKVSSIEDAIKLLESNQEGTTEDKLLADRMALDPDPKKKKEQLNRFARLLRSPDARARRVAAKLLGRGDDLDFAPDLIFALSEGEKDGQVLRIAENSLRILSRQLTTYLLPTEGPVTAADRVKSERHWQAWYLSIRPDHIFIDQ